MGVGGGMFVARQTLTRVEAMSKTSQDIMGGDLSRRIPLNGTGDEFDRLASNLNTMLERIEVLMENVRQVSNDIAHDLRSPLARLREHLELSRQPTLEPKTCIAFDEGITQVDSALSIFAAMLRVAEIEAGARRRDFKTIDLSALLFDLTETFETVADAEDMKLSSQIVPDLYVTGDQELLTQMFVNIIENAIRHSPCGSRIFVVAQHKPPDFIEIEISDNGPGIPASEYTRVLKRFVRLDASRQSPGTGLGLSLVAAVVELHNGQIKLSGNEPGLRVSIDLNSASLNSDLS
jgi:signal transduction histidine kinase